MTASTDVTSRGDVRQRHGAGYEDRPGSFDRLFGDKLGPFAPDSPTLQEALLDIGKPGGIMDARDALERGAKDLILDPDLSLHNKNNNAHTAGVTFFGQFLDHDMTFDTSSQLGKPTRPEDVQNMRTPAFDLDSVYGKGPTGDSQLYDPNDRALLRVEAGGQFEDLPRDGQMKAIIGDPRNDENLVIAGLQAAFLLFHNHAVAATRKTATDSNPEQRDQEAAYDKAFIEARRGEDDPIFMRARRLTTWHYQWMIVHEFLPRILGRTMVDDILAERRFYLPDPGDVRIPVEFQGAAYRFGHSMVRPSYRANLKGNRDGSAFFALIFDPSQDTSDDPDDLRGGKRAPRRFVGWQTFFDFGDGEVRPNKRIDTTISTPLFQLPLSTLPEAPPFMTSLAQRNLLRQVTWELPSGQALASYMDLPVLASNELRELSRYGNLKLDESTPLWYYILKEAEVMANGEHLGPLGARLVGEVMIGLLVVDPSSYLSLAPAWKPTLPSRTPGDFRMVDFLTFAEVDPGHRGQ